MPATDLSLLIDAARAAGEVALTFSGKTAQSWDKPDGAGPVTEADLAVNEVLADVLRGGRPDYGWLSEENEDTGERLSRDRVFIVDPIDGTRSFMEGSGTWAHALAVVEKGEVTAAVIHLPKRDLLFSAAKGQGAFLNGDAVQAADRAGIEGADVLSIRSNFKPEHWRGAVPKVNTEHRPSLAYRMALVAQGRFDAMLTLRPSWEWDVAAGDLILREAGAVTSDRAGGPLRFNNATPKVNGVVAANPQVHAGIVEGLV